jgi:hypothetical protein
VPAVLVLCLLPALPGCRGARTPEEACARILAGLREGDGDQVFEALLLSTQHSFYSVAKSHGQMRALIERSYPPAARAAALARLQPAGTGRDLFRRLYAGRFGADLQRRGGSGAPVVTAQGATATCRLPGKDPFQLARDDKGRWGLGELDREWEGAKLRAVHDLDTVRENVRLYQAARTP